MNRKNVFILLLVGIACLVVGAFIDERVYSVLRPLLPATASHAPAKTSAQQSAATKIAPLLPTTPVSVGRQLAASSKVAPELALLHASDDLFALNRDLQNGSSGLDQRAAAFARAWIFDRCQHVDKHLDDYRRTYGVDLTSPDGMAKLRTILEAQAKSDQQRTASQQLLTRLVPYTCRSFAGKAPSAKDVRDQYAIASKLGDQRATVWMIDQNILSRSKVPAWLPDSVNDGRAEARSYACLNGEEISQLSSIMSTQDPVAILAAGAVISRGSESFAPTLVSGDIDLSMNREEIWQYVACMHGMDCGPSNNVVVEACSKGLCAGDYLSYLRDYVLTPEEYRRVETAAQALTAAIDSGTIKDIVRFAPRSSPYVDFTGYPIAMRTR
jgi:hypothetical protein